MLDKFNGFVHASVVQTLFRNTSQLRVKVKLRIQLIDVIPVNNETTNNTEVVNVFCTGCINNFRLFSWIDSFVTEISIARAVCLMKSERKLFLLR